MLFSRLMLFFYLHQNLSLFFYFLGVHHPLSIVWLHHTGTGITIAIPVWCRIGKRCALLFSLVRLSLLAVIRASWVWRSPILLLFLHELLHLPRQ
jgi:hypothetical protein